MMVTPLIAWRDHAHTILTAVQAAGVAATMNPQHVAPLGCLLMPPDFAQTTGGGVMAAWTVWLIGPGAADADAMYALLDVVEQVRQALPDCCEAEWSSVSLDPDAPARPAYRLTIAADPL